MWHFGSVIAFSSLSCVGHFEIVKLFYHHQSEEATAATTAHRGEAKSKHCS